jgi:hypothetical protein
LWVLPLRDTTIFDFERGLIVGVGTVGLLGVFHLLHFLSGGSRDSFLLIVPLFAFTSMGVSSYCCFKNQN